MRPLRPILTTLILVVAACEGARGDEARIEMMIAIDEDVAAAIDASGGDCAKMAEGVGVVAKKYERGLRGLQAWARRMSDVNDHLYVENPRMKKLMARSNERDALKWKCDSDPTISALRDKLLGFF